MSTYIDLYIARYMHRVFMYFYLSCPSRTLFSKNEFITFMFSLLFFNGVSIQFDQRNKLPITTASRTFSAHKHTETHKSADGVSSGLRAIKIVARKRLKSLVYHIRSIDLCVKHKLLS